MFLSTPPSRVATRPLFVVQPPHTAFLSTPPSRVATIHIGIRRASAAVSIHATLAGGDSLILGSMLSPWRFYPRHPRGWRPCLLRLQCLRRWCFYPRHPRGWRQVLPGLFGVQLQFLSTPPSRVATCVPGYVRGRHREFLSTPPSRVATSQSGPAQAALGVSIHATLAGGDRRQADSLEFFHVSIHATLAGGDIIKSYNWDARESFYPRHPRGWRPGRR